MTCIRAKLPAKLVDWPSPLGSGVSAAAMSIQGRYQSKLPEGQPALVSGHLATPFDCEGNSNGLPVTGFTRALSGR